MKSLLLFLLAAFIYCPLPAQTCSNWLKVNSKLSGVTVGDLDISGDQMTIEASFNATGDLTRTLVSKHMHQPDVNYFLLPDLAQMTTSDGFYSIAPRCDYEKNKTYHVAMVYNGKTLKFYRDGFLMAQTKATGNLHSYNDWPTTIGEASHILYSSMEDKSNAFKGFINEVRMWKVARSQEDIRAYMNRPLPNPATQRGLLAYYTFDNLLNKQGNAAYNGKLVGNAQIKAINPNCTFIADSCKMIPDPAPAAGFEYTLSKCSEAGFKITKKENIKSVKWDFGDGKNSNKETISHVYKKDGNYIVTLTATGNNGKQVSIKKNIIIQHPNTGFDQVIDNAKKAVSFTISKRQNLEYKWLFGDGESSAKAKKISHVYKEDGAYNVMLIATDKNGCSDTAANVVMIQTPEIPVVIASADSFIAAKTAADRPVQSLPEKRGSKIMKEIEVQSDSISVTFYDNAEIDGDSVTIVYNDSIIVTHLLLTAEPKTYSLKLNKDAVENQLLMYAENLGSIPPNTALMVVYDDKKRYEISISSSKEQNGVVIFRFKR